MLERKLSRRNLLLSATAAFLLPGCDKIQNKEQSTFPDQREKIPLSGDVINLNNKHFLLRTGVAYEIPDFERYKTLTKFDKHKRRTFNVNSISQVYRIEPFAKEKEGGVVDIYTGGWKDAKLFGGEINVYFAGFMTDGGVLHDVINPSSETFFDIREGLKKNHWDLLDSIFFTYGDKGLDEYSSRKTVINPQENIKNALDFFNYLKEEFPLVLFNLIGHSLGGIFAFEAAKQNPDCINNLILIDSPVLGIRKDKSSLEKAQAFQRFIMPILGEEKVTDFLFDRWETNRHEVNDFAKIFIGSGKTVISIASTNDLISPLESKLINGAKQVILTSSFESPSLGYLHHHGKALKDDRVIKSIFDIIGENETRNV